jgi:enoyl-CoA hydratase/carnithine racemase
VSVVSFEVDGAVGVITVNNPPLNLLSRKVMTDLEHAVEAASSAPVRALRVRAEGRHFGAGADVGDLFDGVSSTVARPMLARWRSAFHALETLPVPVLAEVQGTCVGGGLELTLHCDLIIASEDAQFGSLEANLGTVTLLGGAQRLAQRIGAARAREFVFMAGLHDARTALSWGLINRVVPRDKLADSATQWVSELAAGPTRCHAITKRLIGAYLDSGIAAADAVTVDLAPDLYDSEDMRHGVQVLLKHGAKNLHELTHFTGR